MNHLLKRALQCLTLLVLGGVNVLALATNIIIVNQDFSGEGLRSTAAVSPVPGNPATTLGGQYRNVFEAAASYWEQRIESSVPIRVGVNLDPLECDARGGILGSAGPLTVHGNFENVPVQNVWYTQALANSLSGVDLAPTNNDIGARFNSGLRGDPNCIAGFRWWLGIGSSAPERTISLYDTILHEIGHGLGFLSLVDPNGRRFFDFDDIFITRLFDQRTGRFWPTLSNSQRASSARSSTQLLWQGPSVDKVVKRFASGKTDGNLRMFAPSSYRPGSSVSHWDTTLAPDELMEPFATETSDSCATLLAFKDIGWGVNNLAFNRCAANLGYLPAMVQLLLLTE